MTGLPASAGYPMPAPGDWPASRAPWRPDPARAVLLVHDLQLHFLRLYGDREPLPRLLRNTAALLAAGRAAGVPVLYTAQRGGQDPAERGLLTEFWGPGMPDDGHAPRLHPDVAPRPGERVLVKHRYSAFARSDLAALLAGGGRDQLLVCGVYAHIGVLATACDAFMRDVRAFVVGDAVADLGEREHRDALGWAAARCARVASTGEVVAALSGA